MKLPFDIRRQIYRLLLAPMREINWHIGIECVSFAGSRHLYTQRLEGWPSIDNTMFRDHDDVRKKRSFTAEELANEKREKREREKRSRRIEQQNKLHPMRTSDLDMIARPRYFQGETDKWTFHEWV